MVIAGRIPGGHPLRRRCAMVLMYGRPRLRGTAALLKPVVEAAERQRQRRVVIFEQEDDDESSMMGEPDLRAGRFGGQLEICACRGLHVARRVTFSRIY
jgi:hypothetical protein